MKKVINLSLKAKDEFFSQLSKHLLESTDIGIGYDMNVSVNKIISGTIKTIQEYVKEQTPDFRGIVKFSFEDKENVYPHYHHMLEENIDVALNRKIHTSTLESICNIIEKFIVKTADQQAEQKKIKTKPLIDSEKELLAIMNYVESTWDGFDIVNSVEFFNKIWKDVTDLTKNNFDQYAFHNLIVKLGEDYPLNYPVIVEPKIINDEVKSDMLSNGIMLGRSFLKDMITKNYDFENSVPSILADLKRDFPDSNKLKPKGWRELAKGYTDYDGMKELDTASLKANFKGMDSGTASSLPFEIRVSLPHVMYDDKCQGRKPLEILVGAMLGHAYVMAEQNNTSKMLNEWIDLCSKLEKSESVQFEFQEPLNKVLYRMIKSNSFQDEQVNQHDLRVLGIEKPRKKLKM